MYSTQTGRFLQKDPLGVDPAGKLAKNPFKVERQYKDGANLYQYVGSKTMVFVDPYGLIVTPIPPFECQGKDCPPIQVTPPVRDPSSGYIGGEAHFFVGLGYTVVTCLDKCENRKVFHFAKVCLGGALGISGGGGIVIGIDGPKCTPENYEKWFYEIGVTVGKGSVGADIGYGDENWGFPDYPSGVVEVGIGKGGAQLKSTWCYYVHVGGDDYTPPTPPFRRKPGNHMPRPGSGGRMY